MNSAEPIKNLEDLEHFKRYYADIEPNMRNQTLLMLGLNTALRISDLLALQWRDVYDFLEEDIRSHICLVEQKTRKKSSIYMNDIVQNSLLAYRDYLQRGQALLPEQYLFCGCRNQSLSRSQAWRIIRRAAECCHISGIISPHSLRKTFGYHAWKQGVSPVLLMDVFNHSSFAVTRRYLGIGQDDRDEAFRNVRI